MATVFKSINQQVSEARARAAKCTSFYVVMIGSDNTGFKAEVTSGSQEGVTYIITRNPQTGNLQCPCKATIVCRHIGLLMNRYHVAYQTNAIPASALPITPNPNHQDDAALDVEAMLAEAKALFADGASFVNLNADGTVSVADPVALAAEFAGDDDPEPEPPAPATFAERQAAANAAWSARIRAKYGEPSADLAEIIDDAPNFPLLMNVAAEVAIVEAEMEADGYRWDGQTWVRQDAPVAFFRLTPEEQATLDAVNGWWTQYMQPAADQEPDAPVAQRLHLSAKARRAINRKERRSQRHSLKAELAIMRADAYAEDYNDYTDSLPA